MILIQPTLQMTNGQKVFQSHHVGLFDIKKDTSSMI